MENLLNDMGNLKVKHSDPNSEVDDRPSIRMHEIVMQSFSFKPSTSLTNHACSHWKRAAKKTERIEDPWLEFKIENYPTENAMCHYYDPIKKIWNKSKCLVKMEWPKAPFASGAMRDCYRLYAIIIFFKLMIHLQVKSILFNNLS